MFNLFSKRHRRWILEYTFFDQGIEFHERDRFLTHFEAQARFERMYEYHTKYGQPITKAFIIGPWGYKKCLTDRLAQSRGQHFPQEIKLQNQFTLSEEAIS